MRIPSGVTDQKLAFYAFDATDMVTPETGLSSFTVYRSRNGGTPAAMTSPTIAEADDTNMPGLYWLTLDEDMTIDAGDHEQEMVFHITHAGMAAVRRSITIFRPDVTAGETLTVSSGIGSANAVQVSGDATAADTLELFAEALDQSTGQLDSGSLANGTITANSIASDAITAAKVAADVTTEMQSGLATAAALATAQADLDTLTGADGVTLATSQPNYVPASAPTADENADALLDRANAIETGLTLRGALRVATAALAGKVSGAGTDTNVFRNAAADSKDRITATVDGNGNRTTVTLDAS